MRVYWMLVYCVSACLARPRSPPAGGTGDVGGILNQAPKTDVGNATGVLVVAVPFPVEATAVASDQGGLTAATGSGAIHTATVAHVKGATSTTTTTSTEATTTTTPETTTTTTTKPTTHAMSTTEAIQILVAKTVIAIPTDASSGTEAKGASPGPGPSSAQDTTSTTSATTTTAQTHTGLIGLTSAPKSVTAKVHLGQWQKGATYQVGDEVDFKGDVYRAVVHHTAEGIDWTPPQTPSMWIKVPPP
ncbi:hypothetical protein RvY_12483 [Ramazzottius varieornatus]|uniref:Chitin-binding type-3 domain-containing protein n=1 Tax=Ramazzottius varieornatus TaxID=947166 RepID=A0A1D1VTF5_RAMVA|nr:hypothetical protein RvY_12483 [Ramazzottius varieornatus]